MKEELLRCGAARSPPAAWSSNPAARDRREAQLEARGVPQLWWWRRRRGRLTRSGAVSSVGGSCFVAGAGRRRRFVALRPRARV